MTMGNYDGAETCELVGIYILHKLADRIKKEDTGPYQDDGLILLRKHNGRQIDKARKDITKLLKGMDFNIEIKTNLKIVDFSASHSTSSIAHIAHSKSQMTNYHTYTFHPTNHHQLFAKSHFPSAIDCPTIHQIKKFSA